MDKEIKNLRLDSHQVGASAQLAAIHVEGIFLEQIAQEFLPVLLAPDDPSTNPAKEKWRER